MDPMPLSGTGPEELSKLLAELETRLRLSDSGNSHDPPAWPVCWRLRVHGDLLTGVAREFQREELAHLGRSLESLSLLGREEPHLIPRYWQGALDRLAEFLDQMWLGLDRGESLAPWLEDSRWARLGSWFTNLGSPSLVMDQIQEILLQWQDSWTAGVLDFTQERELARQWEGLREFGDVLFGCSAYPPVGPRKMFPAPDGPARRQKHFPRHK